MRGDVVEVGALILVAADARTTAAFYQAVGSIELLPEQHDDDPVHFVAELGGCHFAIFDAREPGTAPRPGMAGETMAGFRVTSVEEAVEAARGLGARVIQEPDDYPWGRRALLEDPDGRRVEVFTPPRP
jgi:lactoylglutathione lyase